MRKLWLGLLIAAMALIGIAHNLPSLVAGFDEMAMSWIILACVAWIAVWSGVLALIWGRRR
jgi:hypothetical protein